MRVDPLSVHSDSDNNAHRLSAKIRVLPAIQTMSRPAPMHATLDDWIAREAIRFSGDGSESFNAALDKVIASFDDSAELLGFGEALHGGEDILLLRNRLFQRLVEKHGYSAIALEGSSFPRARAVNDYVAGRGPASYETVQATGFGQGFGQLAANRELVEWMRRYNAEHRVKIRFYGFDIPTEGYCIASPGPVLHFVLDYLASIDRDRGPERRERIDSLLGPDSDWENPAGYADPTKWIGLSPAATALRIEVEDLITELRTRRPELVAKSDQERYSEAVHYASVARELLDYHAALARKSAPGDLMGIRDTLMADNLAYIVGRERGRGKVLAFAHNSHLQRGKAVLPWYTFWPAGSHLHEMFGPRYAVIGSAVGVSDANGIGQPEADTLEARLTALPESALFIPTHKGEGLPASEMTALPTRSGSKKNMSYLALSAQSFTDFDWLAVFHSTTYTRSGPPLPDPTQ
jgi:erythromycin esterase-like protein